MHVNTLIIIPRRFIQTVKAHRPLIKFRKGANPESDASHASAENKTFKQTSIRPLLEDFQLPLRYRRQPLDEAEINAINSGGVY